MEMLLKFLKLRIMIKKTRFRELFEPILMRIVYKSQKKLPYNDQLLKLISSLFPTNFNLEDKTTLVKSYDNIVLPNEFHKLYEEAQSFKDSLSGFINLFDFYEEDIIKFYSDKKVYLKYPTLSNLLMFCYLFHILLLKWKEYFHNSS